jgi:hypothetical protein
MPYSVSIQTLEIPDYTFVCALAGDPDHGQPAGRTDQCNQAHDPGDQVLILGWYGAAGGDDQFGAGEAEKHIAGPGGDSDDAAEKFNQ